MELIGQQRPPPGGYDVARFRGYLDEMERRLGEMRRAKDYRAVFQLTYLTFSRRVLDALVADRFHDPAWATDMCCRFVEVYLEQLAKWDRRDPSLCRPWRMAFEGAEEDRLNVLQAMLLGMNAHINYDLAFVTLGACREAGDLDGGGRRERSLMSTRGGVPVSRYRDFLLINQIGWESIPIIQHTVLRTFSPVLFWGNRMTLGATRFAGARVLLEARDTSWCQTTLLMHARDGREAAWIARLIDAYAASVGDLVGTLTLRPDRFVSHAQIWRNRWERVDPELQGGLVQMARENPIVAELVLQQLAFMGGDPVTIVEALVAHGDARLACVFAKMCWRHAPRPKRKRFRKYIERAGGPAVTVTEALLEEPDLPRGAAVAQVHARWSRRQRLGRLSLARPETKSSPLLRAALEDDVRDVDERLARLGAIDPAGHVPSDREILDFLRTHPDRWVRLCARAIAGDTIDPSAGAHMAALVERVLFLKETSVFLEVEPTVLVHVAEQLEERAFRAGAHLLEAGRKSGGIHVVRSGRIEVAQARDGRAVRIASLGPRDSVGEISALDDTPATADCRAITDVQTYFLPDAALAVLLHEHPRLAIGLIRMLSQRLAATTLRVRDDPEPRRRPEPSAAIPPAATPKPPRATTGW